MHWRNCILFDFKIIIDKFDDDKLNINNDLIWNNENYIHSRQLNWEIVVALVNKRLCILSAARNLFLYV